MSGDHHQSAGDAGNGERDRHGNLEPTPWFKATGLPPDGCPLLQRHPPRARLRSLRRYPKMPGVMSAADLWRGCSSHSLVLGLSYRWQTRSLLKAAPVTGKILRRVRMRSGPVKSQGNGAATTVKALLMAPCWTGCQQIGPPRPSDDGSLPWLDGSPARHADWTLSMIPTALALGRQFSRAPGQDWSHSTPSLTAPVSLLMLRISSHDPGAANWGRARWSGSCRTALSALQQPRLAAGVGWDSRPAA